MIETKKSFYLQSLFNRARSLKFYYNVENTYDISFKVTQYFLKENFLIENPKTLKTS